MDVARAIVSVAAGQRTTVVLVGGAGLNDVGSADSSEGTPLIEDWRLWLAVGGGALLVGVVVGVLAAVLSGGSPEAVPGNFSPGVITWQ